MLSVLSVGLLWPKSLTCQASYRIDKKVLVNGHELKTEIATTQSQRTQGLGGLSCIGADQAMLFEFDRPGFYPFWMKDMRFVIDIVWIDSRHRVVDIKPEVSPSTYPQVFTNSRPAQYVIELKAGRSAQLGINTGTLVNF